LFIDRYLRALVRGEVAIEAGSKASGKLPKYPKSDESVTKNKLFGLLLRKLG
jgi:hypothetical protein